MLRKTIESLLEVNNVWLGRMKSLAEQYEKIVARKQRETVNLVDRFRPNLQASSELERADQNLRRLAQVIAQQKR